MINNAWLSIFGKRESPSEHTRGIRHFSFHAEGQQGSTDVPTAHNTRKQTHTQRHTWTQADCSHIVSFHTDLCCYDIRNSFKAVNLKMFKLQRKMWRQENAE